MEPADLQFNGLHSMPGHYGLSHVLRSRPEGEVGGDVDKATIDRSYLSRLPREHSPGFEETAPEILTQVCRCTHRSEKFFLINVDAKNQWLRTVIGPTNLGPSFEFGSDIIIYSNTLPYYPYWTSDCPEWSLGAGIECRHDGSCAQVKILREGGESEVKEPRQVAKGEASGVRRLTLEGGQFIKKSGYEPRIEKELEVLKIISSHPHIIYSFECDCCEEERDLCEETRKQEKGRLNQHEETHETDDETCDSDEENFPVSAYFMEYMAQDLFSFIAERVRTDSNKPPFETQDSVDILLQIAKAMEHMHTMGVIHCDLKSANILVREFVTPNNVKHYLVKVADFGSAQFESSPEPFKPGPGTTAYSAPEALRQRTDKTTLFSVPRGIDVYSFGIVAFEVLTGSIQHLIDSGDDRVREFIRNVCDGERPHFPIGFVQDTELTSLVEKCWHDDPSQRPLFKYIREQLELRSGPRTLKRRMVAFMRGFARGFNEAEGLAGIVSFFILVGLAWAVLGLST